MSLLNLKQKRPRPFPLQPEVLFTRLEQRNISDKGLEEYLKHWETFTGIPRMLDRSPETLKDHFRSLLRAFSADLHQSLHLNIVWEDGEAKALATILGRLKIPVRTPDV